MAQWTVCTLRTVLEYQLTCTTSDTVSNENPFGVNQISIKPFFHIFGKVVAAHLAHHRHKAHHFLCEIYKMEHAGCLTTTDSGDGHGRTVDSKRRNSLSLLLLLRHYPAGGQSVQFGIF